MVPRHSAWRRRRRFGVAREIAEMTQRKPSLDDAACVTLFGVGGAGGNAVSRLFRQPETGMRIICANTDVQALRAAPSASQLQLGRMLTMGLGAGAKPEI